MKESGKRFWRVWLVGLLWSALALPNAVVAQSSDQDKKQEEQETPYTEEEYAAYEAATQEPDPVKRQGLLLKFLKDNPKSALNPYIVEAYKSLLNDYFTNQKFEPLTNAAEAYLAHDPNYLVAITMAAEGHRNLKNYAKFVTYAPKVFESVPNGLYAYHITRAHQEINNDAQYVEWAQKTLDLLSETTPQNAPIQVELLSRLTRLYAERKEIPKSAGWAQKLVSTLEKAPKPEKATAAEWKVFVNAESANAWSVIGESLYDREKWRDAMSAFQKATSFVRRNDIAYYRLGLCYWKLQDVDNAIDNFARAYVLEGNVSKQAYSYLESLYKSQHNGTTVGINRVLDAARKEMGGSE